MKFSSVEEDYLVIFRLPMPVSLPGREVGVSDSFRTISLSYEAIHSEYLSRTQWLRKVWQFCPFCTRHKLAPWPKTYDRYQRVLCRDDTGYFVFPIHCIYTGRLAVLHVRVGLAQASGFT